MKDFTQNSDELDVLVNQLTTVSTNTPEEEYIILINTLDNFENIPTCDIFSILNRWYYSILKDCEDIPLYVCEQCVLFLNTKNRVYAYNTLLSLREHLTN